jgi:hypothetical protein
MKFASDSSASAPAKQRVVSKKELEASGLSLRDFLNKERGLTRRKESDPTAGEAKDKAAQAAADKVDPGSKYPRDIPLASAPSDGGKATVDRQNAEIKRSTGMTPAEYVRSGKSVADKQTAESSFSTDANKNAADMYTKAALAKKQDDDSGDGMKRGGKVKKMASGGSTSGRATGYRGYGISKKV